MLEDDEAYLNDQLRRLHYEGQGYGDDSGYTVTTTPFRLKSIGDPDLKRSLPIGYETRMIAKEHGLSDEEIDTLIANGAILEYSGDPVPDSVFEISQGAH